MDLDELKAWAAAVRPDLPTARVLDVLVAEYKGLGTVYSPATIVETVGPRDSGPVIASLALLCRPAANALTQHWFLTEPDGEQTDLTAEQVQEAILAGELHHPATGRPVPDYRHVIALSYRAGEGLRDAIALSFPALQR